MATGSPRTTWNGPIQQPSGDEAASFEMQLTYVHKSLPQDILATPPAHLSRVWEGGSSSNRLYYGDNLPILTALLHDPSVKGHVKLIYIDPPFATNSVFHSRSQHNAYQDLLVGSAYVEFIRQRLIILHELLADDGSIYIHLDENMAFYIKVIMDEVFSQQNFRSWITRRKCSHKNYTKKTYGNISDYILFYTKSNQYVWNRPVEDWTHERAKKEYTCVEEHTGRRYKKVPVHAPGVRHGQTGQPWRGRLPPPGKHWQYTPETLEAMDARGEIYWSPTGNPRRKIYLEDSAGIPVQDIWLDFRDTRNQNVSSTGYPTEKNVDVLDRIIQASSNPGDLVLDCFVGSGTTLAVAHQRERCWIGIDSSREAIQTTLQRFSHGSKRLGDYVINCYDQTRIVGDQVQLQQTSMIDILPPQQHETAAEQRITNFTLYTSDEGDKSIERWIADWSSSL